MGMRRSPPADPARRRWGCPPARSRPARRERRCGAHRCAAGRRTSHRKPDLPCRSPRRRDTCSAAGRWRDASTQSRLRAGRHRRSRPACGSIRGDYTYIYFGADDDVVVRSEWFFADRAVAALVIQHKKASGARGGQGTHRAYKLVTYILPQMIEKCKDWREEKTGGGQAKKRRKKRRAERGKNGLSCPFTRLRQIGIIIYWIKTRRLCQARSMKAAPGVCPAYGEWKDDHSG